MPQQRSRHLGLLLVTLALAIGFGPVSVQANGVQMRSQNTMPQAIAAPGAPQREVFGFALASSLSDPTVGYPSWDFSLLSTVAFFGLHVNNDGTFANDAGMKVWNSAQLTNLIPIANSNGTKVVLTHLLYDLEYSNYVRPPVSCRSFCLGPTSPLGYYFYNDAAISNQYLAVVPASKVILGVPYYGRKACVGAVVPNAYPTSAVVADTYLDASQESTSSLVKPGSYSTHRDTHDPA